MRIVAGVLLSCALLAPGAVSATPAGQLTGAVHVTIAPTWFDPAETPGIVTPFMLLYAMHDGLLKPMPGNALANETDPRVRQQILHKIQQLIHERAMFAPIIEPAFLNGVGSRVAFHGLGAVGNFPYSSPYEDLKLK